MAVEVILDASVAAKGFFTEEGSEQARAFLSGDVVLIAPDLIFAEIASVAGKHVWQGKITREFGADAVAALSELLDESVPTAGLAVRAFELAATHRFSAYDGLYLALAEERGAKVITADLKLIDTARRAGLSHLAGAVPA